MKEYYSTRFEGVCGSGGVQGRAGKRAKWDGKKKQVLKASCLTLEIKEFRESEKAGSRRESNPGQLSCRAPMAQARGVLGSTPSDCRPFHFPLISPHI